MKARKAFEVTGKIQEGKLILDHALEIDKVTTVKVIILLLEADEIPIKKLNNL
ncbi:hypothetical protein [Anabaena azotica]|uniref:hypothetical protein n=1 Tax=Anabaena azotica TaxID=197653 RepID=UPI0039A69A23